METDKSMSANPLDEADVEPWLRLYDHLAGTLEASGSPEALRTFRAFGPRRRAHAHGRLSRECQRLALEIEDIGVCPVGGRVPQPGPTRQATLDTDYEILAAAFERCAPIAQKLGNVALKRWLLGRARMHRQHALFLQT